MKKYVLFVFATLIVAQAAHASHFTQECTNASGTLKTLTYRSDEVGGKNLSQATIQYGSLAGQRSLTIPLDELKVTSVVRPKTIEDKTHSNQICGKPYRINNITFVDQVKIVRKDGRPINSDDTPQMEMNEIMLCRQMSADSWPCR